ncbi:MAG: S41 family peptidase [Bacteroidota bacterium]
MMQLKHIPGILRIRILYVLIFLSPAAQAQDSNLDLEKIRAGVKEMLSDIQSYYVYLPDRAVDWECMATSYLAKVDSLSTQEDVLLLFEYLLDEFYENHIHLNVNTNASYRLSSPLHLEVRENGIFLEGVKRTLNLSSLPDLIGAQVLSFNGLPMEEQIQRFPTLCQDKSNLEVQNWLVNKVLAGRYDQPRMLALRLTSEEEYLLDLDALVEDKAEGLLSYREIDGIGIITLHNSLGNNNLITAFDQTLDQATATKGILIDLRNTIGGGNTYVARGILGRFVQERSPYQRHAFWEQYDKGPKVERGWMEYVSPRLPVYTKPVAVLINHWTGSMGEGLAIGFDAQDGKTVFGTSMARLAGAISNFGLSQLNFGYQLPTERLFHVNGTPREKFIPTYSTELTSSQKDETMEQAIEWIRSKE